MAFPKFLVREIAQLTQILISTFDTPILLFATSMLLLSLFLALSPLGKLRLGGEGAKTEFSFLSWFAMLFTCGMGSGLIFWGIAEPVYHYSHFPPFADSLARDPVDLSLALTYFHWGIHAWSIYAISAISIAWFSFKRKRPFHISSPFGKDQEHPALRLIDWMAILSIIFGVAGTFANSIALIETGLEKTFSFPGDSLPLRLSLLMIVAFFFTGSSLLGLHKGIKRLSLLNIILMLIIMSAIIFLMNPLHVLRRLGTSLTTYLSILPKISFTVPKDSKSWSQSWTIIYIIWWVSWTPFVAPFMARISRGRTIRQFLLCVILIPTFSTIIWFSAFGGMALEQSFSKELRDLVHANYTEGLFYFFSHLPMGQVFSFASILLLIVFIITSADSALLVCTLLAGNENQRSKIIWASLLVSLSMALILLNDVDLNKQVAIAGALPFTLIILGQAIFLLYDLLLSQNSKKKTSPS